MDICLYAKNITENKQYHRSAKPSYERDSLHSTMQPYRMS